jgi:predicted naringenin-chalcone synthase
VVITSRGSFMLRSCQAGACDLHTSRDFVEHHVFARSMYVCMYVCIHMYIDMCIYIYIYIYI